MRRSSCRAKLSSSFWVLSCSYSTLFNKIVCKSGPIVTRPESFVSKTKINQWKNFTCKFRPGGFSNINASWRRLEIPLQVWHITISFLYITEHSSCIFNFSSFFFEITYHLLLFVKYHGLIHICSIFFCPKGRTPFVGVCDDKWTTSTRKREKILWVEGGNKNQRNKILNLK